MRQRGSVIGHDELVGMQPPPGLGFPRSKPHDEEQLWIAVEDPLCLLVGRQIELGKRLRRDSVAPPEGRREKVARFPCRLFRAADADEIGVERLGEEVG
jgi:hypothetical protein